MSESSPAPNRPDQPAEAVAGYGRLVTRKVDRSVAFMAVLETYQSEDDAELGAIVRALLAAEAEQLREAALEMAALAVAGGQK